MYLNKYKWGVVEYLYITNENKKFFIRKKRKKK